MRAGGCPGGENQLRTKLVVVGFFQKLLNVFGRFALLEEATERIIAQLTRDVFQRP